MTLTLTLAPTKPRNPLVAPSLFRKAGRHERDRHAGRHQSRCQIGRELSQLAREHPRTSP